MKRAHHDGSLPDLESWLAIERELVPEADELRHRVLQRARASLLPPPGLREHWYHQTGALASKSLGAHLDESHPQLRLPTVAATPRPRGIRMGITAAALVLLSALCATAFYAGYQMRSHAVPPAVAPTPNSSTEPPVVPAPSVVVALVPLDGSMDSLFTNSDTAQPDAGASKVKAAVSARTAEIETYVLELQVLQPARQAVAQRDFARALGAVAEHQRRFPSGKLSEEREALRVKALLGLGRSAEAQRAGTAFRARFPRSALLGRIDEMLGSRK